MIRTFDPDLKPKTHHHCPAIRDSAKYLQKTCVEKRRSFFALLPGNSGKTPGSKIREMQHVFPIPLGDLPFLGYSGACRRQTGRDHPRFWRYPPRRHLSSFYAPARYFTQKASSGTALRTNCLPEARERKERTPKKERKKLKPRPPPRRKAGKQKKFFRYRKKSAPY